MKEALAAHLATALLDAFGMKLDLSAPSHRQALEKMIEADRDFKRPKTMFANAAEYAGDL